MAEGKKKNPGGQPRAEFKHPEQGADVIVAHADMNFHRLDTALKESGLPSRTCDAIRQRARECYGPVTGALRDLSINAFVQEIRGKRMQILAAMTPEKITGAGLRDLAVAYGVLQDKEALLEGKPTSILQIDDRRKVGDLAAALVKEAQNRGIVNLEKRADGTYAAEGDGE